MFEKKPCICATGPKAKTTVLCFDDGHCLTVTKMTPKYQYLLALNAKDVFVDIFSQETYSNTSVVTFGSFFYGNIFMNNFCCMKK